MRRATYLARGLWSLLVALLLVGCVLAIVSFRTIGSSYTLSVLALGLPALAVGSVGLLIATRRTDNAIGWIYLGCGLWISLAIANYGYTGWATVVSPGSFGGTASEWFGSWPWAPLLAVFLTFPFLLFPDGHLLNARWRPVAWGAGVVTVIWTLSVAFSSTNYTDVTGRPKQNPYTPETLRDLFDALGYVALGFFLVTLGLSVWSLVLRFRRGGYRERSQIKWLILAGLVSALFMVQSLLTEWTSSDTVLLAVVLSLLPLACGVAILRYHLYDIDRIIGRTTAYALVTAVLLAVYAAVVTSLTTLVPESGSTGQADSWAVAVATLVAAGLFRPVLRWARRLVDRRFNREQFDAERAVEAFAVRLRDEVESGQVRADLLAVLRTTVQPASTAVWLREPTS
jgi:hypothetical protein